MTSCTYITISWLSFVSNYYNPRFTTSTYSRTCSSIDSISNTICKSRNKCEWTIGSGVQVVVPSKEHFSKLWQEADFKEHSIWWSYLIWMLLYFTILYHMHFLVLYGRVWLCMVLHGQLWYPMDIVLYDTVWYYMVHYGILW